MLWPNILEYISQLEEKNTIIIQKDTQIVDLQSKVRNLHQRIELLNCQLEDKTRQYERLRDEDLW